jgi:acyl dehydratase
MSIDELAQLAGQEIGRSDWLQVTQAMIDSFAAATGDRQWIHVDPERAARKSPFGAAIAHGFLTLSLLSRLKSQVVTVAGVSLAVNYGLNRVRFPAPVRAGARLRGRFTLQSVEPIDGGVQAVLAATVEIEGQSKPAVAAEWVLRYYR